MEEFIKLIRDYRTTNNSKAYFLVLLEKAGKNQFPIYSLSQLLNSVDKTPYNISSSEGWRRQKNDDLKQEVKLIKKEKARLVIAKTKFEDEKKEEAFLKKSYLVITVTAIVLIIFLIIIPGYKSFQENKIWKASKIENTIVSYDNYLDGYPEGKYINEALGKKKLILEREEEIIWNEVLNKNTRKGYGLYLNRLKKVNKYEDEARDRIDIIDWNIALEKNTLRGYKKYVQQHSSTDGKYYDKAIAEIKEFQKLDRDINDNKQWREATNLNSINAYEMYLSSHPRGKYASIASKKILRINNDIESKTSEGMDYSDKIRNFILAEDSRDFDKIYSYYSPKLKRYWQTKNPTYSKLKKQYINAWKSTSYSKNDIDRIVRINSNTYDLYTRYEFYRIKLGKTFTVNSRIRFIFDNKAKISEVYKVN